MQTVIALGSRALPSDGYSAPKCSGPPGSHQRSCRRSRHGARARVRFQVLPHRANANRPRARLTRHAVRGQRTPDDFEDPEGSRGRAHPRPIAGSRDLHQHLVQTAKLEKTDMKLLALEQMGSQTKEVAMRTGLSRASVGSRFQRINTKLHCSSRRASALRAAVHTLLEASFVRQHHRYGTALSLTCHCNAQVRLQPGLRRSIRYRRITNAMSRGHWISRGLVRRPSTATSHELLGH